MKRLTLILASLLMLSPVCLPVRAQTDTLLIPREKIFGNPYKMAGKISPDGRWISWIAPRDGVLNIWIAPTSNPTQTRVLTNERQRPIRSYFWSPDSHKILFINDKGGDENFLLYGVDVATGQQRLFTPFEKTRVQIVGISREEQVRILVGINSRDPQWHDVYSVDLTTAELTPVFMNTGGYSSFVADKQLNVRLAVKSRADGGSDYFKVIGGKADDKPFERISLDDSQTTKALDFAIDGKTLYWLDSRGRDTAALIAHDWRSGEKRVIAESAKADISATLISPKTGRIDAYAVDYLRSDWTTVDDALHLDLEFLRSRLEGEVSVVSRTDLDDKWIVTADAVTAPPTAWLYERKAKRLAQLYSTRPELEDAGLVPMRPVEIPTRDGLTMVAYLTLPRVAREGEHSPNGPVPLVLQVHGGPWNRDIYGYNETHQWLANRGYAVLSPNFRGSIGFGKNFVSAGDLQWGRKMQDDLIDAVDWAVQQGVTTTDKVAIMGFSYGGYATLAALAFTPDKFACGVDIVGPSNLNTLLGTIPPYWQALRAQFYNRMGDPATPKGRALLREISPLFSADRIQRPLLIGQGANDPRVNVAESEQIVDALKDRNIPMTYVLFPDEGHGFVRPQNNMAFNAIAENFLASCLGGRAEPIGDALTRSTAQVPYGAEFVPGLVEALRKH
ncbi:S9 family peptidase [Sphingosinicella rhizophila]|uniref:S9 family peptidase n=1 Tax=Sphingosinicella rhizophila TaxID=3050082 RepID=A0ABU3Q5J9_9SPHN|nr:S9 family peptidase [Sphingosinicella sp. GR2756]MDT9598676.1 S9 family peptidase [Sphingosinicella sp. GR2756]